MPAFTVMSLVQPNPDMPLNDDTVSPGFLGFGVFVILAVAVFFLIRSMNKQIGKIQAPREADLKQQEWERAQAAEAAQASQATGKADKTENAGSEEDDKTDNA